MKLHPNHIFDGKYKIVSILGSGGMGMVYLAEHVGLGRMVAIKVLKSSILKTDDESHIRFEREALAISKLSHPNIGQFFHYGRAMESSGLCSYLVMEFVEGKSLRSILNRDGRIGWQKAFRIAIQVCDALQHAHSEGIIHRDISPANILIVGDESNEQVKVIDFGLAKILDRGGAMQQITQTGELIGNVNYMSPEICKGDRAGLKADIYSLGAVLFESCTGQVTHEADTAIGIIHKHAYEDAPIPNSICADLPPCVDSLLLKCLSIEPKNRYQDMTALKNDLHLALDGEPIVALHAAASSSPSSSKRALSLRILQFCLIFILIFGICLIVNRVPKPGAPSISKKSSFSDSWSVKPLTSSDSAYFDEVLKNLRDGNQFKFEQLLCKSIEDSKQHRNLPRLVRAYEILLNSVGGENYAQDMLNVVRTRKFQKCALPGIEKREIAYDAYWRMAFMKSARGDYLGAMKIASDAEKDPLLSQSKSFEPIVSKYRLSFVKSNCLRRLGKGKAALAVDELVYAELKGHESTSFMLGTVASLLIDHLQVDGTLNQNLYVEYLKLISNIFAKGRMVTELPVMQLNECLLEAGLKSELSQILHAYGTAARRSSDLYVNGAAYRLLMHDFFVAQLAGSTPYDLRQTARVFLTEISQVKAADMNGDYFSAMRAIHWLLAFKGSTSDASKFIVSANNVLKQKELVNPPYEDVRYLYESLKKCEHLTLDRESSLYVAGVFKEGLEAALSSADIQQSDPFIGTSQILSTKYLKGNDRVQFNDSIVKILKNARKSTLRDDPRWY